MTRKRLLKEIDEWEKENIIDSGAADRLRERYSAGGTVTLVTIFSILSSVLIGAGIILLFATNWENIPLAGKTAISFLPMLLGQAAAFFTIAKKYDSTLFRECVSIFYTAGIFATLAMIFNSFEIYSAVENYVLICSLLVLPVIYVLSAVSPLAVYFAGVIFWAERSVDNIGFIRFAFFAALIAGGILSVLRIKGEETPDRRRCAFVAWLSVLASFSIATVAVGAAGIYSNASYLAYFMLIFALSPKESEYADPFKVIGTLGIAVSTVVFAGGHAWYQGNSPAMNDWLAGIIPAVLLCVAAFIAAAVRGFGKLKAVVMISAAVCTALSCLSYSGIISGGIISTVMANAAVIATGIALIVTGSESFDMFLTNAGLILIGATVIMRFFDWDFDIFVKGIAFIAAGIVLFIFNRRLAKKRKARKSVSEVKDQ